MKNSHAADSVTSVVIISDTHSKLDPRIEEFIKLADIAIHAGDIGDANILGQMKPKTGRVIAVSGNNDHPILWPSSQTEFLESIPALAIIDLPGGQVAVEHGDRHDRIAPNHKDLRKAHPDVRLVVYGHTHRLIIDDDELPWIVNPGAAGDTRTRGGPSCLLLTASEKSWKVDSFKYPE